MKKMEQFPAKNPNPVLSVEKNGTVLYSNGAGEPLLHEWGIRVGEKLPSYIVDFVQRVISRNSPEKIEVKVENKIYLVAFHPLPEEECVNIYGFDISEQKELEGKLQESEEKYRNIIETTNEGVWIVDAKAITTYVNKRMAEMFGYTQDEMIGKSAFDFINEEGKAIIKLNMRKSLKGIDESHESKLIRKDGSPLWTLINAKSVFDKDGEFTGSVSMLTDITIRKEAEAKLKETLDNLEELVEERTVELEKAYNSLKESKKGLAEAQKMAHLGNWDWDIVTGEVYCSDEMYRIFGITPQKFGLPCNKILNYIHPDDRENVDNAIKRVLTGEPSDIDYKIVLDDGTERMVHSRGEVAFNEEKVPVRMTGTIQDITERKRAEKALRKSREQYQTLFNSISEGFAHYKAIYDEHGALYDLLVLEINPAGARISGVERDAQVGKTWREVWHDVEDYWFEVYSKVDQTGKSIQCENFSNITCRWYIVQIDEIEKGQFAVTFRDITERKEAEEMRKESESKLKALFNLLPVGVSITDEERNILDANLALENILGLSRSDLLKGKYGTRKYLREDGTEMPAEELPSVRALKEKGSIQSSEIGVIKEDGNFIWTDVSAIALPFSDGEVVIVTRDITENKKAEEKIRNLAGIVESSNDAIITESLDGIITSWNKSAEQIYGYSADEILGKPISILEPPIVSEEIKELVELIEQGDKIHNYETLQLRKDGTILNVSLTLSPIFDISKKLTAISIIARDITKRKKAEEKLQKNEERYRIVTEQTGQLVYDHDLRTDKSSWAGAIEEVTGYSFEEFQNFGKNVWIKNIQFADVNTIDEKFQETRKTGGRYKEELRLRRKDGTYIYVENNGIWLTDHEGQPYRALGVLKDITGTKIADIKLQKSEERYRIAAEQTGQVVFDFNLETREARWAGAAQEVTGYSPEELKNLDQSVWLEHIHPEDMAKMIKNMKNFFRKLGEIQAEFRFRKKDGNYIYMEIRGVWLKDDEGKVYRAIGVLKDITEWKYAMQKIETSEMKYRSIIQNFQGIVFQEDENFFPVFLQGAVEKITGYTEEDFISQVQWEDIIHPNDLSLVLKAEEEVRNAPSTGYGEIDFRLMHKDGKIRWVHEIYQKIKGKNGKPGYYQSTIYDVTERKETEKFLANIETARKKEIHHRIKNNLQVISSLLDLQAEKFNNRECIEDSEVLRAFRESQDRVVSMALIHEELYKGGGVDTLDFSSYLQELTESLFQTYRFGNANISLNMDLEENIFFDMDTAVPLGIITNELVSNALKHAFANRDKGEIQIKLYGEESRKSEDNRAGNNNEGLKGTRFILTVSDNGVGMPESFDLENPGGLGMQLVTTLIDQLEGELELKRDNGTEFIIRFTV